MQLFKCPCFCVFHCCFIQQVLFTTPLAKLSRTRKESCTIIVLHFVTLLSAFGFVSVRIPNISFVVDIGEGKVEELITYNKLLDHLEQADEQDNAKDQELYRFRAIIGHKGPLKATDPNWKGSKWNVQIELETGEIRFELLSVIAAVDPVTCTAYAKEKNLYNLKDGKDLDISSKKKNNSPEPLNSPR